MTMTEEPVYEVARIAVRSIDHAFMAWAAAEAESGLALEAWCEDGSALDGTAYYVYLAALDREEAAARDLQRLAAMAEPATAMLAQEQNAAAQ
jgi:hypothetical protein